MTIRRAELMAALSQATDLAIGQPLDYALKSCVLGMRLAAALGMQGEALRQVYAHALLRYIGCNAESDALATLFGDEIELRRALAPIDTGDPSQLAPFLLRALAKARSGEPLGALIWGVLKGAATAKRETIAGFRAHCETAERFALRFGFEAEVLRQLGQFPERWDGKGFPNGLRGEAIAPPVRVVTLAQDAVVLREAQGHLVMLQTVRKRRGRAYDPSMADTLLAQAERLFTKLDDSSSWDAVLALEPEPHAQLGEAELDEACTAIADFADIKSPFTFGHSRAVAALAVAAARSCGIPEADVTALRRAALLHDIGQVAISSGVFAKPGPLSYNEREKLRLHTYYAERVLGRSPLLARLAQIVGAHHERLDGSGYHRASRGDALSPLAKILAAAEVYQALVEPRPYRSAHSPEQAALLLRSDVRAGRLDSEAVAAILTARGHRVAPVRRELLAGLTSRELDVLRLLAQGKTMKEIGSALGISPKTADNHIQNLYGKIGVRTRAGATLFAIERGLTRSGATNG